MGRDFFGDEPGPRDLMRPFSADLIRMWPISTRVNKDEVIADKQIFSVGRECCSFR